jgi:hypothetical protein
MVGNKQMEQDCKDLQETMIDVMDQINSTQPEFDKTKTKSFDNNFK